MVVPAPAGQEGTAKRIMGELKQLSGQRCPAGNTARHILARPGQKGLEKDAKVW